MEIKFLSFELLYLFLKYNALRVYGKLHFGGYISRRKKLDIFAIRLQMGLL